MKKKACCPCPERLGKVGGQAVMEGVMMRSGENVSVAVRNQDQSISIVNDKFVSVRKKHKFLNIPILRGIVNMVEMLKLSYKTLEVSADAFVGDAFEEEPSKFEKWIEKHFGKKILDVVMGIAMVLGLVLGVGLFVLLPSAVVGGIDSLIGGVLSEYNLFALTEGVFRIAIFILYIYLVSLMSYIRRTFEYHGAEHKTIFCYESGLELTVENVKSQRRFHPRCGTSFLILMLLVGMFISFLIDPISIALTGDVPVTWLRSIIKILLLPITMGMGYELIKLAGKHDNLFTRIISAPGMWLQRLTVLEPTDDMIECAISAFVEVIPEDESDKC